MISIDSVTKKFGQQVVLENITLKVEKGEILGLLGPSGSGKTTLVKMLVNLEKQSNGSITMNETPLPSSSVIKKIGYMAQSDSLYLDLTAAENLDFFASLFGLTGNSKSERISEVARLVNLEEVLNKPVHQFSGGMKRRLSIAASLLHNPELLILDEPTVGIDPLLRQQIWSQFVKLKAEERTIIVTTHVMDEAEKCDRIALLREGRIIAQGSPKEIIEHAGTSTLEQAFLIFGGEKQ